MSNDSTIFTRRTYDDIDEALAWLEQLDGDSGRRPAKIAESSGAAAELPTWLRHDLKLEAPQPALQTADVADDKLSWLDSIAAGHGAAIEESATQSWEETGMYARLQRVRDEVADELPHVEPLIAAEQPATVEEPVETDEPTAAAMAEAADEPTAIVEQPLDEPPAVPAAEQPALSAPGPEAEPEGTVAQIYPDAQLAAEQQQALDELAAEQPAGDGSTLPDYYVDPLSAPTIISATSSPRQLKTNSWPAPRDDDDDSDDETSIAFTPSPGRDLIDDSANLAASIPDDPDEAIAWLERLAQKQLAGDDDDDDDVTMHAPIRFDEPPTRISQRRDDEPTEIATPLDMSRESLEEIYAELQEALPDVDDSKPADDRSDSDLGAAMAWLEELVAGSDQTLDDVTVELDEADVAALLDDEMEKLRARQQAEGAPQDEDDELDEALAWLENFAAEESSFIAPNGIAIGVDDEETLIRLFHDERSEAEQALSNGNVRLAAELYEQILATGRDGAAETVMRDVRDIVTRIGDEPRLYRVWGDALAELQRWQEAAAVYRQALEQL